MRTWFLVMTVLLLSLTASADPVRRTKRKPTSVSEASANQIQGPPGTVRSLEIEVTAKGYLPSPIKLRAGDPVRLVVTRKTDSTCAKDFVLEQHNIDVDLPLGKPVTIEFTPKKSGTLKYGCRMNKMISGLFIIR